MQKEYKSDKNDLRFLFLTTTIRGNDKKGSDPD